MKGTLGSEKQKESVRPRYRVVSAMNASSTLLTDPRTQDSEEGDEQHRQQRQTNMAATLALPYT